MADTLVNTLYPPAVETFQPAFIYTDSASVTFSISPFNAPSDIKYIHVSVTDQRNNENVLQGSVPYAESENGIGGYGIYNGILISSFPSGEEIQSGLVIYDADLDLYSVAIPVNILRNENEVEVTEEVESIDTIDATTGQNVVTMVTHTQKYFNVGQYYKVQLRFDAVKESLPIEEYDLTTLVKNAANTQDREKSAKAQAILNNYMHIYRPYFSEWSTVTLIKPILPPQISFPQFDREDGEIVSFNKGLIRVAGKVYFADPLNSSNPIDSTTYRDGLWEENEHLERYRLRIYPKNDTDEPQLDKIIADSGIIYAEPTKIGERYNYGINCLLDLENTTENSFYVLFVELWSNNEYYYSTTRIFEIAAFAAEYDAPWWHNRKESKYQTDNMRGYIQVNQEDGIAKIDFSWKDIKIPPGNLYIKRACSKDNFTHWDVISITTHPGLGDISTSFEDYTLCSLYRYRYSAQYEQNNGMWSKVYRSNIIYPQFYEMLLERQNRQIAIRYNGQITAWKPVVNRQKVDTLGGKYPKFVENAQMNYKQLNIQGLISAEADHNRKFLNEFDGEWVYNNQKGEYEYQYYYNADINAYNSTFGPQYMVRNDTAPDGEFGYNPKQAVDINDGAASGNGGNNYLNTDHASIYGGYYTDDQYSTSIFLDANEIADINYYQHDLYPHDNWFWERVFRDELVAWLNDGEPKLYRSMPEGNVAVILTDVSLTPTNQLGRRLYQFSATMYEVGDGYSLEDLDRLGIINIPKLATKYVKNSAGGNTDTDSDEDSQARIIEQVGQMWLPHPNNALIKGASVADGENYIWNTMTLQEQLEKQHAGVLNGISINVNSIVLHDLHIQFTNRPHWYKHEGDSWIYIDPDNFTYTEQDNYFLGYLLMITYSSSLGNNTQEVFVNERGYYQVPSSTNVVEIQLDSQTQDNVIIDYIVRYNQVYNNSILPNSRRVIQKIMGQWGGMYPVNTYIGESIYAKYRLYQYKTNDDNIIASPRRYNFTQELQSWTGISVDVTPYALIGIKYEGSTEYQQILVGRSGVFSLIDDTPTVDIAFLGKKMFQAAQNRQPYLDEWEYVLDDSLYGAMNDIPNIKDPTWLDILEHNIVESDDRVVFYFADLVVVEEDATVTAPVGLQKIPFEKWLAMYASSPADISNPKYNTVYPITINGTTSYYIYYIDDKWYPITLAGDGTALAAVPVYGYVNYTGNIVRSDYN